MTSDAEDASSSSSPDPTGDYDDADMLDMKDQHTQSDGSPSRTGNSATGGSGKKSSSKDPLRPRRKKARRACFACQRAHLTCGDERPCQRCIKRGLQDACQDGVRKKAKYLHDAPNEALMPGVGANYSRVSSNRSSTDAGAGAGAQDSAAALSKSAGYFTANQPTGYNIYPSNSMPPPMPSGSPMGTFSNQQSPITPDFNMPSSQQTSPISSIPNTMPQTSASGMSGMPQYGGQLLDPADPSLFNFDISNLNFVNHYGALEFGMLGHMSSGAAETPPADMGGGSMNQPFGQQPLSSPRRLSDGQNMQNYAFIQDSMMPDGWGSRAPGFAGIGAPVDGSVQSPAFAIASGPSRLPSTSPSSSNQELMGYDSSSMSPQMFVGPNQPQAQNMQQLYGRSQMQQQPKPQQPAQLSTSMTLSSLQQPFPRKRPRDTSFIYDSVQQPYAYTEHFHKLTSFLKHRFPEKKWVRIAKAMAAIRPSFISCTNHLNMADLVFTEKCFQRTLMEYEDFIAMQGVPTVIFRRTGEVATVSKEFSILTGWRKDVVLGREPNLNVNTGVYTSDGVLKVDPTETGSNGNNGAQSSTSAAPNASSLAGGSSGDSGALTPGRAQPVFLAELLDEDSVVRFYEDFAKLAFGDSRGYVTSMCKLLKYRTKEQVGTTVTRADDDDDDDDENAEGGNGKDAGNVNAKAENEKGYNGRQNGSSSAATGKSQGPTKKGASTSATSTRNGASGGSHHRSGIGGEAGMHALGAKEGCVECSFCWTVKRDVFEVPMMIVMNFLPCI